MTAGLPRLAAPAEVAAHPAVGRAEELAAAVLVPAAQRVDVDGVPPEHMAAAQEAGLVGLTGPPEAGGGGAPPAVARAVNETLSGACGSTWLVLTQHALPLATVERSSLEPVRSAYLPALSSGRLLAGVAVAHLRRPGRPPVSAEPAGSDWVIDGTVGWFTGWGPCDVFLIGAQHGDDLLFFLVDAVGQPGLIAGPELPLAAMGGTHTISLRLSQLRVPGDRLVEVVRRAQWLTDDVAATANARPAVFGLLRAVATELLQTGQRRSSAEAVDLAYALDIDGASLRAAAYELIDGTPAAEALGERLRLRAAACELTVRAGAALIVAQAGGAMLLGAPAQRWAREALFHQVQAQTADVRAAQLRRYADLGVGVHGVGPR